jgi:hypothetical protein
MANNGGIVAARFRVLLLLQLLSSVSHLFKEFQEMVGVLGNAKVGPGGELLGTPF